MRAQRSACCRSGCGGVSGGGHRRLLNPRLLCSACSSARLPGNGRTERLVGSSCAWQVRRNHSNDDVLLSKDPVRIVVLGSREAWRLERKKDSIFWRCSVSVVRPSRASFETVAFLLLLVPRSLSSAGGWALKTRRVLQDDAVYEQGARSSHVRPVGCVKFRLQTEVTESIELSSSTPGEALHICTLAPLSHRWASQVPTRLQTGWQEFRWSYFRHPSRNQDRRTKAVLIASPKEISFPGGLCHHGPRAQTHSSAGVPAANASPGPPCPGLALAQVPRSPL